MPNVRDFPGEGYQRYAAGARFYVSDDPRPPYQPGLVKSNAGVVYYLRSDGELFDVSSGGRRAAMCGAVWCR